MTVKLIDNGDGTYRDADFDVVWTRTDYSETPEDPDTCSECNDLIHSEHFLCVDDGEAVHIGCVTFHWHVMVPIKTILEIMAKYPEITELPLS